MVVNCSALQLFLAYNLRKPLKISKFTLDYIVRYISLYRDTQVAIYQYVQIVYRYISSSYSYNYSVCIVSYIRFRVDLHMEALLI